MMDDKEIISTAMEAGFHFGFDEYQLPVLAAQTGDILMFARLIAAAERSRCIRVCEEVRQEGDVHKEGENYDDGHTDGCNNCIFAIYDLE